LLRCPGTPISRDQWAMLQSPNIVARRRKGLADLGIQPTPLDLVAEGWLVEYRRHGRFGARGMSDTISAIILGIVEGVTEYLPSPRPGT
jgi:hypothetical protein